MPTATGLPAGDTNDLHICRIMICIKCNYVLSRDLCEDSFSEKSFWSKNMIKIADLLSIHETSAKVAVAGAHTWRHLFERKKHNSCLFSDNMLKLDSKARPSLQHRSCPPLATPSSESQSKRPCTPRPKLLADRFVGAWKVKVNAKWNCWQIGTLEPGKWKWMQNERWHSNHDSVDCWWEPQKWK